MNEKIISTEAERLFEAAVEKPVSEQEDFIREAAGGNPALEREVQSLLAAAQHIERYFDALSERLGILSVVDGSWELPQQTTIGPYKLQRLLARGGMGAVYLAERADEQYQKRVAIKILPVGIGDDDARTRFLAERQILARLDHPNIARLLDGGIADNGAPYFVMDYVDGEPINGYADRLQLGIDERLALFEAVAGAVAFAHQNLVIHRDIKPENVLVDADGNVRLVDFGIAAFVDSRQEQAKDREVQHAQPVTVRYASPEAIRGQTVATTTDVYSLGVLLYVLLSGRFPHDVSSEPADGDTQARLLHRICDTDPLPVSEPAPTADQASIAKKRSTTPRNLNRQLRGDLDAIVAKAMRRDPRQRYATVEQLLNDLDRHRQSEPVQARPATAAYRLGRFLSRCRWQAAAGLIAVIGLLAIVGLSLRYAQDMRLQSQTIAEERDVAEEVRRFWMDTFRTAEIPQTTGPTLSAEDLLDRGTQRVNDSFADRPAMQAILLNTLGDAYRELSSYAKAIQRYKAALALRRSALGNEHPLVADSLTALARAQTSYGRLDAATTAADEAMRLRRMFNDEHGIAELLLLRGRLFLHQANPADARPQLEKSLAMRRRLLGENHVDTARVLSNLGAALYMLGELEASEQAQQQAVAIHRQLNSNADRLAQPLINLGMVLLRLEKYEKARALFSEAAEATDSSLPGQDVRRAFAYNGLSLVSMQLGETRDAVNHAREAWQIASAFMDPSPRLALFAQNLVRAMIAQEQFAEAEPIVLQTIDSLQERHPGHPTLPSLKVDLGRVYLGQSRLDEAAPLIAEGYRNLGQTLGSQHPNTHIAREALDDYQQRLANSRRP